jgi:hypothetical protein
MESASRIPLTRSSGSHMTLDDWYALAAADAERRQLPDLKPVLKGLHAAAATLRAAAWNDDATGLAAAPVSASPAPPASSAQPASPASSGSSTPDATPSSPSSPGASS